ncbi:MAG: adenylate/guanylate cyclase domain-containing protein [Crocinitomicaceae bacterium]|nr:adenylate/guanylate cyclase domain-containing protein [Crocinitomicaceae bacterium]
MRSFLLIALVTFSLPLWSQDVKIYNGEVYEEFVHKYILKAELSNNPDSAYFYYNRALLIANKLEYHKGEIRACSGLVKLYENDETIYERLRYSLMLVSLYEKYGTLDELGGAYHILGTLYFEERLYSKSSDIYSKAVKLNPISPELEYQVNIWYVRSLKHAKELTDAAEAAQRLALKSDHLTVLQQITIHKERAEIYHLIRAYDEELKSYNALGELIKGTKYAYLAPTNWNNIGYTHKYLNNFKKAKAAFNSTIQSPYASNELLGAANFNLGLIYQNANNADSALICFNNARTHYQIENNTEQLARSFNMEAMTYYLEDDQFNAQKNVLQAIVLAKENNHAEVLGKSYEIESFIHQDLFEFEMALESYKRYLSIRDSLSVEERSNENKMLFDQYKVEQLEKQLRLIWAADDQDRINESKKKAEEEAARRLMEEQNKLRIADLEYKELKSLQELQRLKLLEEQLLVENQQKELELIQRDNELKELALERERLVVQENENEIRLLAQEKELEVQRRKNEEQEFQNTIKLVMGALLFILLILIGILFAYRQLRKRKKYIEAQALIIAESKKQIEKEKEKSDGLLLNILPFAVADELKLNGNSKPKLYQEVSVGFTDFAGFTMISEKLSPEELVEKLDGIFYAFDIIIEKHGLERIKTIGDAYMYAAGLPNELEDHAEKIVHASLDIRDYINTYNQELEANEPKWNIRIGVNTGPVVAGVIGVRKFAYDIWGDTVNTAARMESSGEVGKVNISGSTFKLIQDKFLTEHRGKVAAKNKGDIDMYFVELKS